jgi:hypothetical protein
MTRDEVIRLAALANMTGLEQGGILEHFERFAALVAAHEREACAKLCHDYARQAFNNSSQNAAVELRNSIRARGQE